MRVSAESAPSDSDVQQMRLASEEAVRACRRDWTRCKYHCHEFRNDSNASRSEWVVEPATTVMKCAHLKSGTMSSLGGCRRRRALAVYCCPNNPNSR